MNKKIMNNKEIKEFVKSIDRVELRKEIKEYLLELLEFKVRHDLKEGN